VHDGEKDPTLHLLNDETWFHIGAEYPKSRFMIFNVDVWCAMAATRTVFLLMLMFYIPTRVFENLSDYN